ncbi:integrin alpha [Streptomyces sp. PmtG]
MTSRTTPGRLAAATAVAAALTAGLLAVPTTATAAPAPSRLTGDFNGDGHRDFAVAAPAATVGGKTWAGQVVVTYGTGRSTRKATATPIRNLVSAP